jgi:hypothetical protein
MLAIIIEKHEAALRDDGMKTSDQDPPPSAY